MTVRIGFIGVGGMAEHHIKTMQKIEGAKVTAVYDINQTRAAQMADTYGARAYESCEALLDSGQVDGIYLCTPPFARGNVEEAAARRGVHLLVEKPVDLSLDEARRKERIINESGIINSSGYCLRYLDTVQQAKQYLAGKQVNLILAYRLGGIPEVSWWKKMELSGGQLVEMATHQMDLIRYLSSEVKQVHAIHEQRHVHTIDPEATIYDVGTVSFVLESGAVGNITSTCLAKYGGRGGVEFFGNDFYVNVSGVKLQIKDDGQDLNIKSGTDFYLEQNRAFVEAIRTKRQNLVLCSYSEAVKTLAATLAANESAKLGQTVAVS